MVKQENKRVSASHYSKTLIAKSYFALVMNMVAASHQIISGTVNHTKSGCLTKSKKKRLTTSSNNNKENQGSAKPKQRKAGKSKEKKGLEIRKPNHDLNEMALSKVSSLAPLNRVSTKSTLQEPYHHFNS